MMIRAMLTGVTALLIAAVPAHAIDVVEVKSASGVTAYLVEDHTNPIIAVSFSFRGGAALDPVDKLGLSNMVSGLLDEGAGDLESFAFQSRLADLAIRLGFNAGRDSFGGSLTTVTDNADEAFRLLTLALTEPRFDEEPVERIRRQIMVSLARSQESPGSVAAETLFAEAYPDHPYGRPTEGTIETVQGLTRADLVAYAGARFARDRLLVGVTGDITPEDLAVRLDQVFGHLPASLPEDWAVPVVQVRDFGTVVVDKDVPQSTAYLAQPGLPRTDPDWYAATVADYIFGGGSFASRLMDEVREKRGLAYGVSTSLLPFDSGPLMIASVGTRNEQIAESLRVIREEWRKFQAEGPTAGELEDAKRYLTGAWPLRFTSSGRIADILVAVQRDDLGLDYLDRRNDYIEAVTLEDVRRVAGSLYAPDRLSTVVVGRPEGVVSAPPEG